MEPIVIASVPGNEHVSVVRAEEPEYEEVNKLFEHAQKMLKCSFDFATEQLSKFSGDATVLGSLRERLHSRIREIAALQVAISDAQLGCLHERDLAIVLMRKINVMRLQEIQDRRKIQALLQLTTEDSEENRKLTRPTWEDLGFDSFEEQKELLTVMMTLRKEVDIIREHGNQEAEFSLRQRAAEETKRATDLNEVHADIEIFNERSCECESSLQSVVQSVIEEKFYGLERILTINQEIETLDKDMNAINARIRQVRQEAQAQTADKMQSIKRFSEEDRNNLASQCDKHSEEITLLKQEIRNSKRKYERSIKAMDKERKMSEKHVSEALANRMFLFEGFENSIVVLKRDLKKLLFFYNTKDMKEADKTQLDEVINRLNLEINLIEKKFTTMKNIFDA
ncbi:hypothetical protein PCE1_000108 [Barthelona sp. PCE]